jgi:hypothetical protein
MRLITPRLFHRRNRIMLAAGITVALIAAMAGPAGARATAGVQASTPVPVDVTGDMTWTYVYTPLGQGQSGNDTQTVTFHIGLTGLDPVSGQVTGNTSTYSLTDNLNETSIDSENCQIQLTGSFSGSGPVAMNGASGPAYGGVTFDAGLINAQLGIHISYAQAQTSTFSGPSPDCNNSTSTSTVDLQANPGCFTQTGPIYPGGPLQGAYPNATVNLDCSATAGNQLWREDTTITGTLTITPSCGGAAAPSQTQSPAATASRAQASLAAASSCGLTITSPPDNSIIAISDPNFVDGAEVGANDRAPALDTLKLDVAGTSAGCSGPVTVNGVSATSSGDDWTAKIPLMALAVGGVGQVTLTAKAGGCSDASSTVTLINLEITNPTENEDEQITDAPAMPKLDATVSVYGYPGDTSDVSFDWMLDARGETVARPGTWSPYSYTTTGSTTGTSEAWQPSYDQIVGGVGRLTVEASLPGVTDTVTSFPRWINIPGNSPDKATVIDYLNQYLGPNNYADTISQIFCVESRWMQFGNNGKLQDPIPNVPTDWTPNPGPGQPLYGRPADIGIAQLSPEVGTLPLADYWNWQTNVQDGIAVFDQKLAAAPGLAAIEQDRLTKRWNKAIAIAKANRKKIHDPNPPTVPPLITVPQLSDQEILWQAVRLYNGGREFHFNADYIVSANGLDVVLVAPDTGLAESWVGGGDLFSGSGLPGVPPSPAGSWRGLGNHSQPMQWTPTGKNPSYDEQVRACPGTS